MMISHNHRQPNSGQTPSRPTRTSSWRSTLTVVFLPFVCLAAVYSLYDSLYRLLPFQMHDASLARYACADASCGPPDYV
jgi:hypothetical protein